MINFLKYKWIYGIISTIIIFIGIFSMIRYSFSFSIDFIGGSIVEYKFDKKIAEKEIRTFFDSEKIKVFSLNNESDRTYLIKTVSIDERKEHTLRRAFEAQHKVKIETLRFETVGPTIGKETQEKTIIASITAIVGIFLYLTFSFSNFRYGLAAILAMIHDFLVVLGSYSLLSHFFGAEVDTLFVTAILTSMSFSVHDTIIVFDKIREYRKNDTITQFSVLANKAFTETIVRSLNNSLTTVLMLIALVLLGGSSTRFFVSTLLIGIITGTYSSPFIAIPLLDMWERKKQDKK